MRAARPVLALGLVAALSAVGVADAATKPKPKPVPPVCNLVTDPAGDGTVEDGVLDVLSADVAGDGRAVTTAIRLASGGTAATLPVGTKWQVNFVVDGVTMFTSVLNDQVNGLTGNYGFIGDTGGSITGTAKPVVDAAKKEIRMSVPAGAFSPGTPVKLGKVVSGIVADAGAVAATPQALPANANIRLYSNDTATSTKTYKVGTKSCVTPGK